MLSEKCALSKNQGIDDMGSADVSAYVYWDIVRRLIFTGINRKINMITN